MECWGAKSGDYRSNAPGLGGYVAGNIVLTTPQLFYICVGQAGSSTQITSEVYPQTWNGGGAAYCGDNGGGGGWYGGGHADTSESGGGGSSFISGHSGCQAIDSSGNPISSPNHYSGFIFTNTKMIDGAGYAWTTSKGSKEVMPNPTTASSNYASGVGHSGSGYARITCIPYD